MALKDSSLLLADLRYKLRTQLFELRSEERNLLLREMGELQKKQAMLDQEIDRLLGQQLAPSTTVVTRVSRRHYVPKALLIATPPPPPKGACYLLDLLLAKADRETISGDLLEEFETSILPKYGPRRARFWFWAQAARAIAERNRLSRWVLVYGMGRVAEWIFKAIGS
jgi:hypothetical protein